LRDAGGGEYTARAYGEERADGNREGWLEFHSAAGAVRRTERETTQPGREALAYWASGLEPVYLDGAFTRAS
jgi:hypothetical protein